MTVHDLSAYASAASDSLELATRLMKGIHLPPQPKIVAAISEELMKPEPDFRKISDLVEQDAALVSQVLKVTNSPLFGLNRPVTSIKVALSLLGVRNFYSMVMTTMVRDALGFKDPGVERVWLHSLQVAKLCDVIARRIEEVSPDEAYLVGLFHDSAIPVLLKKFSEYHAVIKKVIEIGGDIRSFEEEHFNTHHALVGAVLSRSWGLPSHIYRAIRFHHADSLKTLPDSKSRRLMAVLMLADHLAREATSREENEDKSSERWKQLGAGIEQELSIESMDELRMAASTVVSLGEQSD